MTPSLSPDPNLHARLIKIIHKQSKGYKSAPIELFVRACMVEKSADLAQLAITPGWCKPWLPSTPQAWRMLSATQAWATRARAMASVCMRYLQRSKV